MIMFVRYITSSPKDCVIDFDLFATSHAKNEVKHSPISIIPISVHDATTGSYV